MDMHNVHDEWRWRVEWIGSERTEVALAQASLRIGCADDCDIVLPDTDAAAHHLTLHHDKRGLVLEVMPAAARVYVNARPVHNWALLRLGDIISVGSCKLRLKQADSDFGQPDERAPPPRGPACLAGLRGVAGPLSGRRLAIDDELLLDAASAAGFDARVKLRRARSSIAFEVLKARASDAPAPRFNGVVVQRGRLHVGDQLTMPGHGFVIEAPGVALVEDHIPFVPPEEALPEQTAGSSNEVWWLIATASVLALGIALLLLLKL